MRSFHFSTILAATLVMLAAAGCSPKFNWRDYSSPDSSYRVLFPGKPATHTRSVNLDGLTVDLTMTAVDIDGTTFAVGTGEAPDAVRAQAAMQAMKTALVKNIGATVKSEKTLQTAPVPGNRGAVGVAIQIEASGKNRGQPMRLAGRFESRDKRFYQVIVMGKDSDMTQENVDMFMSSFRPQ